MLRGENENARFECTKTLPLLIKGSFHSHRIIWIESVSVYIDLFRNACLIVYWIHFNALLYIQFGVEAHRTLVSARYSENTIGRVSFQEESQHLPWVPTAGGEMESRKFASLVLVQAAKQHRSMSLSKVSTSCL